MGSQEEGLVLMLSPACVWCYFWSFDDMTASEIRLYALGSVTPSIRAEKCRN